ncbi:hypothetical protein [Xanthomonas oryzae]|uniref:hypothetical protein n=1 Tax=Xanthomonas oryzae TaxID=347 RepID=UPI0015BB6EBA|nr:hypothetical protein [Xanthomonas oryzae]UXW25083.1 hypothetical protein IXO630_007220 [Xanthomonas oryzae pv. oryzae]
MISLFAGEERDAKRQQLNDPLVVLSRHIDFGGVVRAVNAKLALGPKGLSSQLCNQVFHSAFIGTRSSPNITWKLCRASFQ